MFVKVILFLLYWTGLFRLWLFINRRKIAILVLHQVRDSRGGKPINPCGPP